MQKRRSINALLLEYFFMVIFLTGILSNHNGHSFILLPCSHGRNNCFSFKEHRRKQITRFQAAANEKRESTSDKPSSRISANKPLPVDPDILFSNAAISSDNKGKKKKKKNKYAQFSKADKIEKDPLDSLIEESQQKLQSLQEELNPIQQRKKQQEQNIPSPPPEALTKLEFPNNKDIDPYDPSTFGYVEIGTIQGPHGVYGWTKVQGNTDFPERLTRAGTLLHIKPARKRAPRSIVLASGKYLGDDQYIIQLQGIFDRDTAKSLRGATLYYAKQQDNVELQDDEVIVSDLVGLSVYQMMSTSNEAKNENRSGHEQKLIGTVLGVVLAEEMCAIPGLLHDQIEIGLIREDKIPKPGQPQELVLIPMVPEIIPRIDLEQKCIVVDPPSGLLNLTYVREEKVRIKGLLAPAKE